MTDAERLAKIEHGLKNHLNTNVTERFCHESLFYTDIQFLLDQIKVRDYEIERLTLLLEFFKPPDEHI